MAHIGRQHTHDFLSLIGVAPIEPSTSAFDPGYDAITLEGHLQQSHHLISLLKISMACWIVADERVTRHKIAAAKAHSVPTVTGGGPFEIAVAQGRLPAYLDLCADIGVTRIECGEGFTDMRLARGRWSQWPTVAAWRCSSRSGRNIMAPLKTRWLVN